jgi:hypothetical protein
MDIDRDETRILVRYHWSDPDEELEEDIVWLACSIKYTRANGQKARSYRRVRSMENAYDWLADFDGDLVKALDMANKLAKVCDLGKKLTQEGYEVEVVLVRTIFKQTVVPLTRDNPLAVLAAVSL